MTRTDQAKTPKQSSKSGIPQDLLINHDLDLDDDLLDPLELRRRAIEDANASFDKFARQLG